MTVATLSHFSTAPVQRTVTGNAPALHRGDRQPLIVIDPSIESYQFLVDAAEAEVVVLDATKDGVEQLSQILADRQNISLQVLAHGESGRLYLGTTQVDAACLLANTVPIRGWGRSLSEVLIYACHLAEGKEGRQWVDQLTELTGVAIAASDDVTGAGGNWDLEYATGNIASQLAIPASALTTYPGKLQQYTVSSEAELRNAINASSSTPEDDTIIINGTIELTSELPTIRNNITFNGNTSATINGSGKYRVFKIDGGTVKFVGLTIADGLAQGANGTNTQNTNGGNAQPGQGGGIYIKSGEVTLSNVTIQNSMAVGGNGGNSTFANGGNGEAGQGGAIYIEAGKLRLGKTTLTDNKAKAGLPGKGAINFANGRAGTGKGGAIYVNPGAEVTAEINPVFTDNEADSASGTTGTDNDNVFGAIVSVPAPQVSKIERAH
jgi:hypothetical protein